MHANAEVLGDGPAAWAVAIGLAQRNWPVTVRGLRAKPTSRIELLAASAVRRLTHLGIGPDDLDTVAQPCPGTWSCWGAEHADCQDAVTSIHGAAWSVDRARLDALLRKRAMELGVTDATGAPAFPEVPGTRRWQVLAYGGVSSRAGADVYDDRLIAFTVCGVLRPGAAETDARLLIEALPEGWTYGMLGPNDTGGVGLITDAQAVAGHNPWLLVLSALRRSCRISRMLDALAHTTPHAKPVPCRWRPVRAGTRIVRVGDAQASFDPISGRGLWEGLRMAEQVAAAVHDGGGGLLDVEEASRDAYFAYLARRAALYAVGAQRFLTPFWARRVKATVFHGGH